LNLPSALLDSLVDVPGFNANAFIAVHQEPTSRTAIRINPAKRVEGLLFPSVATTAIPWCSMGFNLAERPSFTIDPLFHAGAYYVQEASSMFLCTALQQSCDLSQPLTVLDLCAAPGGKSTLIQSLLSSESVLVSNEVIKTRVQILSENITKWGAENVLVTQNDPRDFERLPLFFDVIIVDAPCSGSGLFRKDPDAISEWSEAAVALCSNRQQRILADVLPALKPGGILIYSTCSYSVAENEQISQWLVEEKMLEGVALTVHPNWNIIETNIASDKAFGYRFYPNLLEGEGFYLAAFRKSNDGGNDEGYKKRTSKLELLPAKAAAHLKSFIEVDKDYLFIQQAANILAIPANFEHTLHQVKNALYLKKAGINLGSLIRTELVPDHELAMSNLAAEHWPVVETDLEIGLQFLRKQAFHLATIPKGWALLSYRKIPLGWIKGLSNRINNYYPKEWRILHK
jgi:16S rRNA C967 or C1407 C5-methylase (RsmB/RsmF family)/NOL1/NOP2/fmu family ribosome biogenesis protein